VTVCAARLRAAAGSKAKFAAAVSHLIPKIAFGLDDPHECWDLGAQPSVPYTEASHFRLRIRPGPSLELQLLFQVPLAPVAREPMRGGVVRHLLAMDQERRQDWIGKVGLRHRVLRVCDLASCCVLLVKGAERELARLPAPHDLLPRPPQPIPGRSPGPSPSPGPPGREAALDGPPRAPQPCARHRCRPRA
jgi:hypothetical protein